MAFQGNAFQGNAFQGAGAQQPGGPVSLGAVVVLCSAAASGSLSVRKAFKPSVSAAASLVTPLRVQKVFRPFVSGTATASSPVSVKRVFGVSAAGTASFSVGWTVTRGLSPTAAGQATVSIVLGAGTPAPTVSIGPAIVLGQSDVSCFTTIYRDIGSGVASGGGTELSIGLSIQKGASVKTFRPTTHSAQSVAQQLRSLISDHRETARRAEGEIYSGILNPVTTHEEYPGIPLGEFDQYELAELVRQQEYTDQKSDYDNQIRVRDQNLELAQRRLRIQTNRPQGLPRPPARDKLAQDILDKREREANWRTKANMARVRSFRKR